MYCRIGGFKLVIISCVCVFVFVDLQVRLLRLQTRARSLSKSYARGLFLLGLFISHSNTIYRVRSSIASEQLGGCVATAVRT
jgi:hypothetical protein